MRAYFAEHEKNARRRLRRVDEDVRSVGRRKPGACRRARHLARVARTTAAGAKQHTPDAAALFAAIPEFPADTKIATRKAGQDVLQPLASKIRC